MIKVWMWDTWNQERELSLLQYFTNFIQPQGRVSLFLSLSLSLCLNQTHRYGDEQTVKISSKWKIMREVRNNEINEVITVFIINIVAIIQIFGFVKNKD